MKARVLQLEDKTTITVDSIPCGSGGSGEIFKILSPPSLSHQVVKLYYKERLNHETEEKIKYLISKKINQGEHESVVWVKNIVRDNGKFVGFTMNFADGIGLEQFLNDRWWRKNTITDWNKFKLENENGIENRVKLCLNIAIAVNIIHKSGNYSIVDIKPANFKVHTNGLVSIIDIDNIAIIENGKQIHAAQVITPDFTPPEAHNGLDFKQNSVYQTWDRYSLGILFYNILCGVHPFSFISCKTPYENCTDSPALIHNGLFLYGNKSSVLMSTNSLHSNFQKLHNEIRNLFLQCFENGHSNPDLRPSAEDWCRALSYKQFVAKRPTIAELVALDSAFSSKFKNALQFNIYSSPLVLETDISVSYPDVNFVLLSKHLNVSDRVIGFFKKSPKQLFIDKLKVIENEIRDAKQKEATIRSEIMATIADFNVMQNEIRKSERTEIDKLKEELESSLSDAEFLAEEGQREEVKELTVLQNQINSLISKEESSLAEFHDSLYGDITKAYEKKRLEFQTDISNNETQKKNEIEKLINQKDKLLSYNIERECMKIFSGNLPAVIATLKRLNFVTAADFSRVSIDGRLLNSSNNWVKIPGMGPERSKKLHYWRLTIEDNENAKISRNVSLKYNKLQSEISLAWNITESTHNKILEPLNVRFKTKETEIKRNKNRLNQTKEAEMKKTIVKYDELHLDLKKEFIEALNKFYSHIETVYAQTRKSLQSNYLSFDNRLKSKATEVKELMTWIGTKSKEYNDRYLILKHMR